MNTKSRLALVCDTPALLKIHAQGYKSYGKADLSLASERFPMGSKELLAFTVGFIDAESDAC